jgi:hypothetical protein
MRKEVVSYEETHEDPVVKRPLKVKWERLVGNKELRRKIFSKDGDMEPDERFGSGGFPFLVKLSILHLRLAPAFFRFMAGLTT